MKLSLCIAARNEEANIHIPLDSTYDFVDEVVLVDDSSTDRTAEVARAYGDKVRVIRVEHQDMFHASKQVALEHAKGDWILQLDADEAVSPSLKEEILNVISHDHEAQGFNIPRKNFFLTRFLMKGGQYPDYTIRLYRRGKAHFPCKSVHENVAVEGKVDVLTQPLLHYADPDFSRYLSRWDRYTSMDALQLVKTKKHFSAWDFILYFKLKPLHWFFLTYFRHRGYADGFPGFVFCLFSALRFWPIYIKTWVLQQQQN